MGLSSRQRKYQHTTGGILRERLGGPVDMLTIRVLKSRVLKSRVLKSRVYCTFDRAERSSRW